MEVYYFHCLSLYWNIRFDFIYFFLYIIAYGSYVPYKKRSQQEGFIFSEMISKEQEIKWAVRVTSQ